MTEPLETIRRSMEAANHKLDPDTAYSLEELCTHFQTEEMKTRVSEIDEDLKHARAKLRHQPYDWALGGRSDNDLESEWYREYASELEDERDKYPWEIIRHIRRLVASGQLRVRGRDRDGPISQGLIPVSPKWFEGARFNYSNNLIKIGDRIIDCLEFRVAEATEQPHATSAVPTKDTYVTFEDAEPVYIRYVKERAAAGDKTTERQDREYLERFFSRPVRWKTVRALRELYGAAIRRGPGRPKKQR